MTELSRRAAEKHAGKRGLKFVPPGELWTEGSEPERVAELSPDDFSGKPAFWEAVLEAIAGYESANPQPVKPAKSKSRPKPVASGRSTDVPYPKEGHFSVTGYCQWPGKDDHGHKTCSEGVNTEYCTCDCHKDQP